MKPTFKIFFLYLLLLILLIGVESCSSVKRVLNDPVKFEQVAREVVKRGYCVNDSVTLVTDSIIYVNVTQDSIIKDTVDTPCPDFITKTKNGATVISKNGVLTVDYPIKIKTVEKIRTKTITNNIRDKKLESILKKSADSLQVLHTKSELDLKQKQSELSASKRKNVYTWIGIGLVVLVVIGLKTGLLKKFIPFL